MDLFLMLLKLGLALCANTILHILLLGAWNAREDEVLFEETVRHLPQRAEIGQLLRRACAEEHDQPARSVLHGTPSAFGEGPERRRAGPRADHDDVGLRIVRHEERRAERAR